MASGTDAHREREREGGGDRGREREGDRGTQGHTEHPHVGNLQQELINGAEQKANSSKRR